MKSKCKKEIGDHRRESRKNGGGPTPPPPSQEALEILDLLPMEFVDGTNKYDCDVLVSIFRSEITKPNLYVKK